MYGEADEKREQAIDIRDRLREIKVEQASLMVEVSDLQTQDLRLDHEARKLERELALLEPEDDEDEDDDD